MIERVGGGFEPEFRRNHGGRTHGRERRFLAAVTVCVVALLAVSCAKVPKRRAVPRDLAPLAVIPGMETADVRDWGDELSPSMRKWSTLDAAAVKADFPAIYGRRHTYLAISGGGAKGAFGAGLLVGWTAAGDRPEFTIVTGISTGALTAPFAFLGPDYDDALERFYTTVTTADILKERGLIKTLTGDAATSTEPLQELLASVVDENLMRKIAAEHRKGRRLFVGTTDLDAQRPVTWSIGAIAASGAPGALELIRKVLLASAAIPAAFPPVLIEVEANGARYDELHVDGGVTSQVFLYPSGVDWEDVLDKLAVPAMPDVYVIRNSKLVPEWESTENRLGAITTRSVASLIRTQGIGDLYRLYLTALRDGLRFHLAYIPEEFDAEKNEEFDPDWMRALFDLGYDMAKSGYPWEAMPPEIKSAPVEP